MENVIPEELEHVPVTSLGPCLVHVQLSSVNLGFFLHEYIALTGKPSSKSQMCPPFLLFFLRVLLAHKASFKIYRADFQVFFVHIYLDSKIALTTVPNLVSSLKSLALSRSFASST